MGRPSLTRRRLLGLDRSEGPPPETVRGAPLRPFTLPNAIGPIVFLLVAWGDQLDGVVARVTGQYSRLGALMDPLTDRALVLAGVVVCWHFELLPRWALGGLAGRELLMLALTQVALRIGMDLRINMMGRWAVWPVFLAIFLAMISTTWVAAASLYVGLAMTLAATALYLHDGYRQLKASSST